MHVETDCFVEPRRIVHKIRLQVDPVFDSNMTLWSLTFQPQKSGVFVIPVTEKNPGARTLP